MNQSPILLMSMVELNLGYVCVWSGRENVYQEMKICKTAVIVGMPMASFVCNATINY
jgi:hypothetical protein